MASASYQHSILYKGENPATAVFQPKRAGIQVVKRYRRGQEPAYVQQAREEEERERKEVESKAFAQVVVPKQETRYDPDAHLPVKGGAIQNRVLYMSQLQNRNETMADKIAKRQRLQQAVELDSDSDEKDSELPEVAQRLANAALHAKQELLNDDDSDSDESSSDEDAAQDYARREQVRLQVMQRARIEEDREALKKAGKAGLRDPHSGKLDGAQELDDSSSSEDVKPIEEDDDDSSDDDAPALMSKPVFIPKNQRQSEKQRKEEQIREEELRQMEKIKRKRDKEEIAKQIAEDIANDENLEKFGAKDNQSQSEYDLDSDEDETVEAHQNWKVRELERVLFLKNKRNEKIDEMLRIEIRRNMTEEEKAEDDARIDAENEKKGFYNANKKEKTQMAHMQKYHHAGGYYQDKKQDGSEALYLRNAQEALDSEKYDKQLLPKSMQVRRGMYSMKGQQKHTNLKDADTTDWTAGWVDGKTRDKQLAFNEKQKEFERQRKEKIAEMHRMGTRQ